MSYRRFNANIATGNFTGVTTGASINGNALHMGERNEAIQPLAAHVVATITMTNATIKLQWQGSNDAATWFNLGNQGSALVANAVYATGVANGTTVPIEAPWSAYAYKYCRVQAQWTSTTAGTTNDAISIGYTYRQMEPGEGQA